MELLKKLDSLNIQATDKISKEDLKFIDSLKKNYELLTSQLLSFKKLFTEQEKLNSEFEKLWESEEDRDYVHLSHGADKDTWGARYFFTFKYPLKHIKSLLSSAYYKAQSEMINHFNDIYSLRLDATDYQEICKNEQEIFDFEHCLDWIISQTGGLSLADSGIKLLKEDFASEVNRGINTYRNIDYSPKLNKNTITFPDYVYYKDGDSLDWGDNRKYNRLLKAILHFENFEPAISMPEEVNRISCHLPNTYHDRKRFNFTSAYETILTKVVSIRFYKNNKVDVKFASPELAMEFANYFSIVLAA